MIDKNNMISALIYTFTLIVLIIIFTKPFSGNSNSIIEYEIENFMN